MRFEYAFADLVGKFVTGDEGIDHGLLNARVDDSAIPRNPPIGYGYGYFNLHYVTLR